MVVETKYATIDRDELKRLQKVDQLLHECRAVISAHQQTVETMLLVGSSSQREWEDQESRLESLAARVDSVLLVAAPKGDSHE